MPKGTRLAGGNGMGSTNMCLLMIQRRLALLLLRHAVRALRHNKMQHAHRCNAATAATYTTGATCRFPPLPQQGGHHRSAQAAPRVSHA